jgi:hypothetical protein
MYLFFDYNQRTNIWDYIANQILNMKELITFFATIVVIINSSHVFLYEWCHPMGIPCTTSQAEYDVKRNIT